MDCCAALANASATESMTDNVVIATHTQQTIVIANIGFVPKLKSTKTLVT
jgi:hypothetical protein